MNGDTVTLATLPDLSDLLLTSGKVRLRIASRSMVPTLRPGDEIVVASVTAELPQPGDLVLFEQRGQLICHRVVTVSGHAILTRGDATSSPGEWIHRRHVIGKVVGIKKRAAWVGLSGTVRRLVVPVLLRWVPRLQRYHFRPHSRPRVRSKPRDWPPGPPLRGGTMNQLALIYQKNPDIVARKVIDELILVPVGRQAGDLNSIYTLNEVGARMWELIDGKRRVAEIRDQLVEEFDVSEKNAEEDLLILLQQFHEIGAIEAVPTGDL